MTAEEWLNKNGYTKEMIFTFSSVAIVMEQFNYQENKGIPMDAEVKPDFAYLLDEFKKRVESLVEKNPKATYYNNGLRNACRLLNQVLDDVEL